GRRRSNGQERRLGCIRDAELEVLARAVVGAGKLGRIGDVDADVEEGGGGGLDLGEQGGSPNDGVLADSGGDGEGGEAASDVEGA
ncbi:hypothetical protein CRG98_010183, partial [Punica granatum]